MRERQNFYEQHQLILSLNILSFVDCNNFILFFFVSNDTNNFIAEQLLQWLE